MDHISDFDFSSHFDDSIERSKKYILTALASNKVIKITRKFLYTPKKFLKSQEELYRKVSV